MVSDVLICFFFFKQKTAYELRISDWSSDVCSSDLRLADDARRIILYRSGIRRPARRVGAGMVGPDPHGLLLGDGKADLEGGADIHAGKRRSEERRVGKECVSTGRSRW